MIIGSDWKLIHVDTCTKIQCSEGVSFSDVCTQDVFCFSEVPQLCFYINKTLHQYEWPAISFINQHLGNKPLKHLDPSLPWKLNAAHPCFSTKYFLEKFLQSLCVVCKAQSLIGKDILLELKVELPQLSER